MLDTLDPRYLLSIFMRRFPVFLLTAILIFVGFAAAAVLLPATYTSQARILVESQQIPTNLVQSTVASAATERLRVIEQRLMTRENLLEIARQHGVFADRRDLSPTEIVQAMRSGTRFRQANLGGRGGRALMFTVSFSGPDGAIAAKVVSEYVTRLLEDNRKIRTARAADTYRFFDQESDRLIRELTAIESEIVEFKRANRETLPETLAFRTNDLTRVQQRQQLLDREMADLSERRGKLEELRQRPESLVDLRREPTPAERQLVQLEDRRALRIAILSENHPEIRSMDVRIAALQRVIEREEEERSDVQGERFQQVVTEGMQRIGQELELIDQELEQKEDELVALERREAELERSIAETPNTQMSLNGLQRDYAILRGQYDNAQGKLAVSATGEQLELTQQAERFELIEQAQVPQNPDKPDRFMIVMMGVAGGGGAGLGLIVLLEFLNRAIRRPSDVMSAVQQQPLAVIPYIYTDAELTRRSRVKWALIVTLVAGTVGLIVVTHVFYLPLDLLAGQAMEMTQIDSVLELLRSRLNL